MSTKPAERELTLPVTTELKEAIRRVEADDSQGLFYKRKLLKQAFKAFYKQREDQFSALIEVDQARLDAYRAVAKRAIVVEREKLSFDLRKEFLEVLASVGLDVEMTQLDILTRLGEQLHEFRKRLATKTLEPSEREIILELCAKAFTNTRDKLEELTSSLIEEARMRKEVQS
jgi:hypothetical protein